MMPSIPGQRADSPTRHAPNHMLGEFSVGTHLEPSVSPVGKNIRSSRGPHIPIVWFVCPRPRSGRSGGNGRSVPLGTSQYVALSTLNMILTRSTDDRRFSATYESKVITVASALIVSAATSFAGDEETVSTPPNRRARQTSPPLRGSANSQALNQRLYCDDD